MILSNLVKKSKPRTLLCLARPRFESEVYTHTKFDLSSLISNGWIDTKTEIHLYNYDGVHAVSKDAESRMLGAYGKMLRYSNNTASVELVVNDPEKFNDGNPHLMTVNLLQDIAEHVTYVLEPIKTKYGVRKSILNVRCHKEGGGTCKNGVGALYIPTQTKNIQTVNVYSTYGDLSDPSKTPLNCFVNITDKSLTIRLEDQMPELYIEILRGNTQYTIMDGLQYKGSEEFNISVEVNE